MGTHPEDVVEKTVGDGKAERKQYKGARYKIPQGPTISDPVLQIGPFLLKIPDVPT